MKLTYTGLDGKRYTAEWVSNPLGHLKICHEGKARAIKQPLMSEGAAEIWMKSIMNDPNAKADIT